MGSLIINNIVQKKFRRKFLLAVVSQLYFNLIFKASTSLISSSCLQCLRIEIRAFACSDI